MEQKQYPFYLKATTILLGLVLFVFILKILGSILTPLAFASIVAILLNPLVNRLKQYKVPNILSIILAMLTAILVVGAIFYFLSSQITSLARSMPALEAKANAKLLNLQTWLEQTFGLSMDKQSELMSEAMNNSKALIGSTLNSALGTIGVLVIIPVYVFLLLFYKSLLLNFLYKVFAETDSRKVGEILGQTKIAIQSYMVGLLLEASVVAVMNTTALLIIGVKYAVLLGVLGALLNVLPYIGGLIAITLPLLMATVSSDGYTMQFWIIIAFLIIQFIDNNILVPKIVSSKVQINALFSIIGVLLGGALWGVAGMFLSILFIAILKIVFDRIDGLKPWGELLGDEIPTKYKPFPGRKRRKKSVSEKIVNDTKDPQ